MQTTYFEENEWFLVKWMLLTPQTRPRGGPSGPGQGDPGPGHGKSMPGHGLTMPGQGMSMPGDGFPMPGHGCPMPGHGLPMPGPGIPVARATCPPRGRVLGVKSTHFTKNHPFSSKWEVCTKMAQFSYI